MTFKYHDYVNIRDESKWDFYSQYFWTLGIIK